MKRILLISLLISSAGLFAQKAGPMPGASVTWKNDVGYENEILLGTAYNFTYKHKINFDQYWVRAGAGFGWSGGPKYKLRLGLEMKERFKRNPRWGYFYGVDLLHQVRRKREVRTIGSVQRTTNSKGVEAGIGVGVGIEFHWGERVSTGFEMIPAFVVGSVETNEVSENMDTGDVTTDHTKTPYLGMSRSFDRSGVYIAIKF